MTDLERRHHLTHAAMGCGSMSECSICKAEHAKHQPKPGGSLATPPRDALRASALGDVITIPVDPSTVVSTFTWASIQSYLMIGVVTSIAGGMASELLVKPLVAKLKGKK